MKYEMKKNRIALALIISATFLVATVAAGDDDLVKRLEKKYNSAKTYSARFEQEVISSTYHSVVATGKGRVFFKSPGKMRWEYTHPEKHIVVIDGKYMWDYYEEDKLVVKTDLERALPGKTPKAFMFGMGSLRDDFKVTVRMITTQDGKELANILLEPKAASTPDKDQVELGPILLTVDPKKMLVISTEFNDFFGNSNNLKFKDIKLNKKLKDSIFTFKVPKGVKVVSGENFGELMEDKEGEGRDKKEKGEIK